MSKLLRTARICFDVFLFAAVYFAVYAISKWFEPHRRGFFCDDESLRYPLRESTVSMVSLLLMALVLPSVVITAVELFRQFDPVGEKRKSQQNACHLGYRLVQCLAQLSYFLFGTGLCGLATFVVKYTLGRLRPHFFAVCQPQLPDGSTCADLVNHGRYIDQYVCVAENYTAAQVTELGQSFPSGHSSAAFYAMVYLCVYLQATVSTRASKLLKHLLQFIFIMFAWYLGLSRVVDHYHHWSDVLVGALLGTLIAVCVAVCVANVFGRRRRGSGHTAAADKAPQVKPATATTTTITTSANSNATAKSAAAAAAAVLPAYTFGSMPYLHHPHQYGQTYHNYGYVP